jgi:biopolymer transport protein ExbD
MRFQAAKEGIQEGDMTPMIDMVFQLIAFFMVLVNFSEVDQNQQIRLPSSELAKPPDAPLPSPITLQVRRTGSVILGPNEVSLAGLRPLLTLERQLLEAKGTANFRNATVIIRADAGAKIGEVQKVITLCQETGFEKFALRAKQQERQEPSS